MNLNKEFILRRWAPALLSGEYEQGRTYLHNTADNTWCVLGVALDLLAEELGIERYVDSRQDFEWFGDNVTTLPQKVAEHIGVTTTGGYQALDGEWGNLFVANDEGMSFEEIAALLLQIASLGGNGLEFKDPN